MAEAFFICSIWKWIWSSAKLFEAKKF